MEKILTLHPEGKNGVRIDREKYELIKSEILAIMNSHGMITFKDLLHEMNINLTDRFEGSIAWYTVSVKLDLEARKILERISGTSPQKIKLIIED